VLRDRRLLALLVAETVSTTGSQMTWLALPWFVLTTTGSPGKMTLVLASEAAGLVLMGLPGGTILTRLGSRWTMMIADGARAPFMLVIPLLYWSGALTFPLLLVLVFVVGALTGPYFAAQRTLVPELVGEDEHAVGKANTFLQSAQRVTMLLGPAVAGVLIAWVGAPSVLVIDAATYVVSFVLVGTFVRVARRAVAPEQRGRFLDGFRFIARDRLLRGWCVAFITGDAAWMAFFAAVPVLVVADYGADPRIAGWIFASFGVGAVIGNVLAYRLQGRTDGLSLVAALVYGQALPLWVLVFHVPAAAIVGAIFVSGFFNGVVNPAIHTLLTLSSPPAIRARVMPALSAVMTLSIPLGLAFAGPLLSTAGAHPVLVGFAVTQTAAMALVSILGLRVRAARRADELSLAT
jgi:predicted MFS family arabinose efflux permease